MSVIPPTTPLSPPGASPRPYGAVFEAYVQRHHGGNGSSPVSTLNQLSGNDPGWQRIVENVVYLERFLNHQDPDATRLNLLVAALQAGLNVPIDQMRSDYVQACRKNQLCGGPVTSHAVKRRFACVVARETLLRRLFSKYGGIPESPFEKLGDLTALLDSFLDTNQVPASLLGKRLSGNPVWVTWSPDSDNPFDFIGQRPAGDRKYFLLHCLGLDDSKAGSDGRLLLLEFDWNADLEFVRPTIADAADYPYFRPPPSHITTHGMTDWTGFPDPDRFLDAIRRPEALLPILAFTTETTVQEL